QLWDIAQKKLKWEVKQIVPGEQLRGANAFAVSHGGKYAVLLTGNKLRVVNLATGDGAGMTTIVDDPSRCYGLSFSPDGKELAALNEIGTGAQLLVWDFADGKTLLNHSYYERLSDIDYHGPGLQWMPDKSGLLISGHVLVDRETGEEIWNLPTTNSS